MSAHARVLVLVQMARARSGETRSTGASSSSAHSSDAVLLAAPDTLLGSLILNHTELFEKHILPKLTQPWMPRRHTATEDVALRESRFQGNVPEARTA